MKPMSSWCVRRPSVRKWSQTTSVGVGSVPLLTAPCRVVSPGRDFDAAERRASFDCGGVPAGTSPPLVPDLADAAQLRLRESRTPCRSPALVLAATRTLY